MLFDKIENSSNATGIVGLRRVEGHDALVRSADTVLAISCIDVLAGVQLAERYVTDRQKMTTDHTAAQLASIARLIGPAKMCFTFWRRIKPMDKLGGASATQTQMLVVRPHFLKHGRRFR